MKMEDRYVILTEKTYNVIMEALIERPFKEVANIVSAASKDVVDNTEKFVLNLKEPVGVEAVAETTESETALPHELEVVN